MSAALSFDPSIPVEDSDTDTDEIIYRISHDLRASVRALQELPSWISDDLHAAAIDLPGASSRHLELIASHACRLDLMLTGLLDYSRVGRMQPIAAINPGEVLGEVLEDLALPETVSLTIEMDRGNVQVGTTDLQRVFSILITNAVRFHPERTPKIKIEAKPVGSKEWRFRVTDNGAGIPPDKRDFVLRPMTKLVSRDVDPGAGMGLAILNKVARTYGGRVEIDAGKSGTGTQVSITMRVN